MFLVIFCSFSGDFWPYCLVPLVFFSRVLKANPSSPSVD